MKHSSIPDYREDTGADAPRRLLPRISVALLGIALASTGLLGGMTQGALISAQVTGFVLLFLGVRGFWLPYVKASQLVVAAWVAASGFVFGVAGFALAAMLVIAAAVAVVSLTE